MSRGSIARWLLALTVCTGQTFAQGPPPGGGVNSPTTPEGFTLGFMSQGDVKGLADFVDSTRLLEAKALVPRAVATRHGAAMLKALQVSCQLTDARHIASGKAAAEGKPVDVGLYEVACSNGMGYLLTLRDLTTASGISCLAASAAQGSAGAQSAVDLRCHLPANEDLNAMATAVIGNAGATCPVNQVKWLGESAEPKLDYTDAVCADGREVILRTPAPGSAGNIEVLTCKDAAGHGARCELTAEGSASAKPTAAESGSASQDRPTLDWFKNALRNNGVACEVQRARVLGRESIKKRYIVEYQCPQQQPRGVVAYVPSDANATSVFDWVDCPTAASRKLYCQLTSGK